MGGLRRILDRLTYANVVATLALFIALGGASYAAIELPAHSVGANQLREGAVTPDALGFPLGARMFTPPTAFAVPDFPHCSDLPPGASSCVVAPEENLLLGHLHLHAPTELALNALLTFENAGLHEGVEVKLFEDEKVVATGSVEVASRETVQVPLQTVISAGKGVQSIGLGAWANYGPDPKRITLGGGTVIVTAFPAGSAPGASTCTSAKTLLC
jgi:hypothetical protein